MRIINILAVEIFFDKWTQNSDVISDTKEAFIRNKYVIVSFSLLLSNRMWAYGCRMVNSEFITWGGKGHSSWILSFCYVSQTERNQIQTIIWSALLTVHRTERPLGSKLRRFPIIFSECMPIQRSQFDVSSKISPPWLSHEQFLQIFAKATILMSSVICQRWPGQGITRGHEVTSPPKPV